MLILMETPHNDTKTNIHATAKKDNTTEQKKQKNEDDVYEEEIHDDGDESL